jgi:hypothetical protein
MRINYLAIAVAAVVWFAVGSLWYSPLLFGKQFLELSGLDPSAAGRVPAWKPIAELVKGAVVAYVLARFIALPDAIDWKGALGLGLLAWIGFPVMVLASSVMWQNVPLALAGIHAGDWLVKMSALAVILGKWR